MSPLLDRYSCFVDESQLDRIYDVARSLAGLRVLHLNTTAQGGGVAEILHQLIPLMEELGIKHEGSTIYPSHEQARLSLFEYLEIYYNRQRRHSTLGYVSPLIYEQAFEAAD